MAVQTRTILNLPENLKLTYNNFKPKFSFGSKEQPFVSNYTDDDGDEMENCLFFYYQDIHLSHTDVSKKMVQDKLLLFGKVLVTNPSDKQQLQYETACVTIQNYKKSVFFIVKNGASRLNFEKEVKGILEKRKIIDGMEFIYHAKKKYCFELDITTKKGTNEVECLEVIYPMQYDYTMQSVPYSGFSYQGKIGNSFGPIHSFILDKEAKGPGWIVFGESSAKLVQDQTKVDSWCKWNFDVDFGELDNLKYIGTSSKANQEAEDEMAEEGNNPNNLLQLDLALKQDPELTRVYLNLNHEKVSQGDNQRFQEIKSITISKINTVELKGEVSVSNLMIYVDKKNVLQSRDFESLFPQCEVVVVNSEVQLLRTFVQKISIIDPDVYIGSNITTFFFESIFDRIFFRNIDEASKVTRIKKSFEEMKFGFKKISKFEKLRNITAGRLVMDIEETMQEFVNEVDYDLAFLARKYFDLEVATNSDFIEREEDSINPNLQYGLTNIMQQQEEAMAVETELIAPELKERYLSEAKSYLDAGFSQNIISILLEDKFKFLELTKQLTKVTGCIWDNSLRNSKTARNEMLIMHYFKAENYILPDYHKYEPGTKKEKKMSNNTYKGGLVINPKKGLYRDYVLMLDFMSLYPSIIREFQICFTSVQRAKVGIKFYTNREEYEEKGGYTYDDIDIVGERHFNKLIKSKPYL